MNRLDIKNLPVLDYYVQSEIDRLRVNVGFTGSDKKMLMITSSVPNEGKSYISVNLWLDLSRAGNRTCLVDMDMRKSEIRKTLGLAGTESGEFKGLSHYLAGRAGINDVVYQTNVANAYIIPTLTTINPSLLLDQTRMDTFLSILRKNFDYVILDTPPLGVVSDGQLIASKSDGAILVIRAHETSRASVKTSVQQIEKVGCPLVGVVLNRVKNSHRKGAYTKKGYSSY